MEEGGCKVLLTANQNAQNSSEVFHKILQKSVYCRYDIQVILGDKIVLAYISKPCFIKASIPSFSAALCRILLLTSHQYIQIYILKNHNLNTSHNRYGCVDRKV